MPLSEIIDQWHPAHRFLFLYNTEKRPSGSRPHFICREGRFFIEHCAFFVVSEHASCGPGDNRSGKNALIKRFCAFCQRAANRRVRTNRKTCSEPVAVAAVKKSSASDDISDLLPPQPPLRFLQSESSCRSSHSRGNHSPANPPSASSHRSRYR